MSKRRNVKKEKASRNRAYARQFRKKFSRSYSKGRRFFNKDEKPEETKENNSSSSQSNSNS